MEHKVSDLRAIVQQVYKARTLEEGEKIILEFLQGPTCQVRQDEKVRMTLRASQCSSLLKLQTYLTNSLLRYEGMRVR
jgi:hypothetical protein